MAKFYLKINVILFLFLVGFFFFGGEVGGVDFVNFDLSSGLFL